MYVNETPTHQAPVSTIKNHKIVDCETKMRIHLTLNGIFSYFPTRELTLEEVKEWESYSVVFITPNGDDWDPYASHFADNEAAMLNSDGLIVDHDRPSQVLFTKADLCKLYGEPVAWDVFDDAVD